MVRYVTTIWSEKLHAAVGRAQREASLVDEYRVRLIADAVTGKVDVRKAAPGLSDVDPRAPEHDSENGFNRESGSVGTGGIEGQRED